MLVAIILKIHSHCKGLDQVRDLFTFWHMLLSGRDVGSEV